MAIHFSILTWRIPWTEEPGRLQPTGLQKVGVTTHTHTHTHIPQRLFLIGDPGQHIESGVCSLSHISWEGRISQLELTPNFTCCLWSSSGSPDYFGPVDWQQRGCVTFWPKHLGASGTPPPLSPSHTETVEATISRQCNFRMKEECPACIRFSLSKKEILFWGKPVRLGDVVHPITPHIQKKMRTALMVQWLRLCACNAGGPSSILDQGAISHKLQLRVCVPHLEHPDK